MIVGGHCLLAKTVQLSYLFQWTDWIFIKCNHQSEQQTPNIGFCGLKLQYQMLLSDATKGHGKL